MPLDNTLDASIIGITDDVPRRRAIGLRALETADDEVVEHVSAHTADADEADCVGSGGGEEVKG